MKFRRFLLRALAVAAVLYAVACAVVVVWERDFLYFPDAHLGSPESYGLAGFKTAMVTAEDGVQVLVWHRPAAPGFPTIVLFHGNGGSLAYRAPLLAALTREGFGMVALEYRGYGPSGGSPSEQGLYRDARAALAFAATALGVPAGRVVLYGESLGTGVAVQMATECACAALVLQSPYTSIPDVARFHVPVLPVHWLMSERYDSRAKIASLRMPLMVLHGEADTVVPAALGRELFAAAPGPKEAEWVEGRGHNDLDPAALAARVRRFTAERGLAPTD